MSKKTKDALVVGFALFAVFFWAGNLIFPPLVGVVSGSGWPAAIMGLMLSGILLPIATIVAVDNMGGRFEQLCLYGIFRNFYSNLRHSPSRRCWN